MRVHYFQHVPFEGLGCMEALFLERQWHIGCTRFFDNAPALPSIDDVDLLVVMGGPMGVNDAHIHPWLATEKAFIHDAIAADKPVLGICLGAQLIASAMGAEVFGGEHREIGWFPIDPVPTTEVKHQRQFSFPGRATVFHWHGDTFTLPEGAVHLARSQACQNQAFQLGGNVLALQCHVEMTPAAVEEIVAHCADELVPGPFIQSAAEILAAPATHYSNNTKLMREIIDFLLPDSAID